MTNQTQQPVIVRSNTGPAFIFLSALVLLAISGICLAGLWLVFGPHSAQAAAPTSMPTDTPTASPTPNAMQIAGTLAAGTQMANYATQTLQAANGSPTAVPPTATFTPSAVPQTTTATDTPAPVNTTAPTTAATQAVATTDPTQPVQINGGPVPPASTAKCPSDGDMQKAFGFDTRGIKPVNTSVKSEGDVCKWTLQAVGVYTFTNVPFLKDWQITDTERDQRVRVYYGDGVSRDIMGATFRYMPAYDKSFWVWDPADLMAHEFNFGMAQGRAPAYPTLNGNLNIPDWDNYDGKSCPANVVQLAGLVGGSYKQWTWKDWSGGADVFKASPNQYILLTAPSIDGANSWIDYWNGQLLKADKLTAGQSLALNEASFHCDPQP